MPIIIDTPIIPSRDRFGRSHHGTVTVDLESNQDFLDAVIGCPNRYHYQSNGKLFVAKTTVEGHGDPYETGSYDVATVSLGIQAIHQAFASHVALGIRPDTLWYMIVHEVAEHVRQHPDTYAGIFTATPESKQTILVRDNSLCYDAPSDWMRSIGLVREPLAAKVTDRTLELFVPSFSTSTPADEIALLVAFMDTVSPYYRFEWQTMCGIPQVRLEGTAADWQTVYQSTDQLASMFDGLNGYFSDLLPVLETIVETASGTAPDEHFWRSIYKYGGGSGGPYVNGWITAFFAHIQTRDGAKLKEYFDWSASMNHSFGGFSTNQFPSHISRVPFVWDYLGTYFDMAFIAGITGVDYDDNFLSPQLGFAVAEV